MRRETEAATSATLSCLDTPSEPTTKLPRLLLWPPAVSLRKKDLPHDGLPVHVCYHLRRILQVSRVTFEHVQVLLQSPPIMLGPGILPGGTLCRLKWRACLLCWQRASARVAAPRLAFRVTPRNASFLTACKLARLRAFLARDSEVVSNPAGLASVGGNDSRKSEQKRQGCAHVEVAAHRKRAALISVWRWRRRHFCRNCRDPCDQVLRRQTVYFSVSHICQQLNALANHQAKARVHTDLNHIDKKIKQRFRVCVFIAGPFWLNHGDLRPAGARCRRHVHESGPLLGRQDAL